MNTRLMLKLSTLPWRKSFTLQSLIGLAVAQLFLGAWLGGAIDQEIRRTEKFAKTAKWITVQLKDEKSNSVSKMLEGMPVSVEELSTDQVLSRMETEEPEVVQTVKAMGKEGLQLVPKVVLIRGVIADELIEKIKVLPEVGRVDVSPVHHIRLQTFYHHLQIEMRIGLMMVLFLIMVMLLGLQRIELRDLREVKENLLTWGANHLQSRLPLFFSLMILSGGAGIISIAEWLMFKKFIWRNNPFLGELSIDQTVHFPMMIFFGVLVAILLFVSLLSFSGNAAEE